MRIYREFTPVTKDDVFVLLEYEDADFEYPIHSHPEYELNLVLNSSGNRIVGDSVNRFDGIDLVLIGPNVYHSWDEDKISPEERQSAHVITIQFEETFANFPLLSKDVFKKIKLLLEHSVRGVQFLGKSRDAAIEALKKLGKLNKFDATLSFLRILHQLAIANEHTFLASVGFSAKPEHSKSRRINEAYQYILNNFQRKITLSEVAQIANMSDSAFSHLFKKSTNKNFTQFVIDLRIGFAAKLLVETKDTIGEICFQCGFNNVSNFNRLFKKNKSLTPVNYRKQFEQPAQEIQDRFEPIINELENQEAEK